MAKAMSNPPAAMQQMLQNDPRFKNIMDLIAKNGGDAEGLVYQIIRQRGIDPQTTIGQIQESYNNFMNQFNAK